MSGIKQLVMGMAVVMAVGLAWTLDVRAEDARDEEWSEIARAEDPPPGGGFVPGTKGQFQAGALFRFAGDQFDASGESYLFTFDVNVLFHWDRRTSTWGVGWHAGFDGDENVRMGPKALWRISLKPDTPRFFQAGAGIYLYTSANEIRILTPGGQAMIGSLAIPGLFLEAELGLNDWFSLNLGFEVLRLEYVADDFYNDFYGLDSTGLSGEKIETSFYAGSRLGGWQGGLLVLAGVAVAGIAVASTMGTW